VATRNRVSDLHIRRRIVCDYAILELGARQITGSEIDGNLQMVIR
jgi:hypothetical protein